MQPVSRQLWVVVLDVFEHIHALAREAGWVHGVGGRGLVLQRAVDDGVAVNGVAEGLAHLCVVKRLVPAVEEEVVGDKVGPGDELLLHLGVGHDFSQRGRGHVYLIAIADDLFGVILAGL